MEEDNNDNLIEDLMNLERENEITQASTLQGQIIGLALVLKDLGVINKEHLDLWEKKSEEVRQKMLDMAHAQDDMNAAIANQDEEALQEAQISAVRASIAFMELMGNTQEELRPMHQKLRDLCG